MVLIALSVFVILWLYVRSCETSAEADAAEEAGRANDTTETPQRYQMPQRRPQLRAGVSAIRGRAWTTSNPRETEVDDLGMLEENEAKPRLWTLQILFMLMSVMPPLLSYGARLAFGNLAYAWLGFGEEQRTERNSPRPRLLTLCVCPFASAFLFFPPPPPHTHTHPAQPPTIRSPFQFVTHFRASESVSSSCLMWS